MAIDIGAIDRAIAKLQELRKLASDPDVAPFLKNGSGPSKQETPIYKTALGGAVINACREQTDDFTVKDIADFLIKIEYKFRGQDPKKSVGNVLRALARDGHIKIKQQGKGRRETIYQRN
ncbi:MAG TPA: hypothetical protein VIW23_07415 [Candidatus Acidoferrum sp.]|jgi:hypothetical protein